MPKDYFVLRGKMVNIQPGPDENSEAMFHFYGKVLRKERNVMTESEAKQISEPVKNMSAGNELGNQRFVTGPFVREEVIVPNGEYAVSGYRTKKPKKKNKINVALFSKPTPARETDIALFSKPSKKKQKINVMMWSKSKQNKKNKTKNRNGSCINNTLKKFIKH